MNQLDLANLAGIIKELRDEPFLANNEDEHRTVQLTLNALAIRLSSLYCTPHLTGKPPIAERHDWLAACGQRRLDVHPGDSDDTAITRDRL